MKLPLLSSDKVLKILMKQGFEIVRRKGSHIALSKKVGNKTYLVTVIERKQIKRGTLLSMVRQSGMTKDEFLSLIK